MMERQRTGILYVAAATTLLLLVALVYSLPPTAHSFSDLSAGVPTQTVQRFQAFHSRPVDRIQVRGRTWEYRSGGRGTHAVLFLHGMGGSAEFWWQQFAALERGYRVIAPTYPPVDTLEDVAEGVLAILDAERLDRVAVVGTSLGGYVAQFLVANHPGRFDRVLLSNTFPPNDILAQRNGRLALALRLLPEWIVLKMYVSGLERTVLPAAGNSPLARAHLLSLPATTLRRRHLVARYNCLMQRFPVASSPAVPLLIVESDNDPLVPPELRRMLRETYPHARVVTLRGRGHFPYLNAADEFNQILLQFLAAPQPIPAASPVGSPVNTPASTPGAAQ